MVSPKILLLLAAGALANNYQVSSDLSPCGTGNLTAALEAVARLAQQAVSTNAVPGIAIGVVAGGRVVYTGAFGVRKVGGSDLVTPETVFPLASVSKPIGSTIVAAVLSRNPQLSWDDRINAPTTLADFSDPWISEQVTVADGFSHRTGLFPLTGDDLELYNYNRTTIFSRIKAVSQFRPFRDFFGYSNYGLTLGAVSVARSIGKEWADVAKEYLFDPLGMSSTSSRFSDFISRSNRASLHVPATSSGGNGSVTWVPSPIRNPDPQSPAGGVTSNVVDLAKWVQLHLAVGKLASGAQLIDPVPLNASLQPQIVRGPNPVTGVPAFYGYGWNVDYRDDRVYNDHAGAFTQGVRTQVKMSVKDGLGIVVLANCFPTGWPEGISDTFFDLALFGRVRRDYITIWNQLYENLVGEAGGPGPFAGNPPSNPNPPLSLRAYTGRYVNEYVGAVLFSTGQGSTGLTMTFPGSSNASVPVTHWSRDTFYIDQIRQDPAAGISFAIGPNGTATSVTIDQFNNVQGLGVLVRG